MLTEWWSDLRYRLRALAHRTDADRELDDELRFHLEREADKYQALGMPRDEALRRARLAFGGVESTKEESRDARGTVLVQTLVQDVRYAMRGLRSRPAFTAGVVLTLGLGIGTNAAMVGIVDRLLLRPPAYLRDAEHVHRVYLSRTRDHVRRTDDGFQFPRYLDLVRWTHDFSAAAAISSWHLAVGDGDAARVHIVAGASASYFDFFDARPVLGRFYTAREDSVPFGAPVAVLGYGFWRTEFGGRPDVLGTKLRIGHTLCTIIGVAPPGFHGVEEENDPAAYIPVTTLGLDARGPGYVNNYGFWWISMIVRVKPGVGIAAANADLTSAFQRSWQAESSVERELPPMTSARPAALLAPLQRARGPLGSPEARIALWVAGVAFIVLLIACANVANLLLARAVARRREIALRRALGVTHGRLVQQLLTESIVLATLGGITGIVVAQWGGALMRALFLPPDFASGVVTDGRTLAVMIVSAIGAAVVTGLAPVIDALRSSTAGTLVGAGRDTGLRTSRGRAILLVFQATLSVVLLVGAGLFVRSLEHVRALRLGFDVDPLLVVTDNSRGVKQTPAERLALENRLVDVARSTPGVVNASIASSIPFWGFEGRDLFISGIDSVSLLGNFDLQAANPDYFRTVGTRLLRGRAFDERDGAASPRVVVVSLGMAKALWPGEDPLGKCIRIAARDAPCATVIGVAEDLHLHSLTNPREYMYYIPIAQHGEPEGMLFVRVAGDAPEYVEIVRRRLQREMPGASYVTAEPFQDMVDPQMRSWRLGATMFVVFGALALALAGIGLYSIVAYGVAQRQREIGVRIALGASRGRVVRLVVRGGVRLVVIGIVLGGTLALLASRAMAQLLFQESPTDPVVYAAVAGVLIAVALAATILPALGAGRVDPNVALRAE
jgi:putative ABC transport system permease protein